VKHLPKIVIGTIPHRKHRYPTAGDYYRKNGEVHIRVSQMNPEHEFLVVLHELVEWFLIERKGISIETIDKFDIAFENRREQGNTDEPGDDPNAPYYDEHQFATLMEQLMADKLGVNWSRYDEHVNSL